MQQICVFSACPACPPQSCCRVRERVWLISALLAIGASAHCPARDPSLIVVISNYCYIPPGDNGPSRVYPADKVMKIAPTVTALVLAHHPDTFTYIRGSSFECEICAQSAQSQKCLVTPKQLLLVSRLDFWKAKISGWDDFWSWNCRFLAMNSKLEVGSWIKQTFLVQRCQIDSFNHF